MSHDPMKFHVYPSTSTSQKKNPQTRQIDTTISFQDIQSRIPTCCSMLNAHSMPTLTQKEFRCHGNFRTHVSAVIQMAKKERGKDQSVIKKESVKPFRKSVKNA